jgi:hypothetical protein
MPDLKPDAVKELYILALHAGHDIEIVANKNAIGVIVNVAVECYDCGDILIQRNINDPIVISTRIDL